MEELTIKSLKKIGKRYSTKNTPFNSFNRYGYSPMTHSKMFTIFIHSIITFSSDESLKNFLNNELLNLTKEDLKEIFGWFKPIIADLESNLAVLLRENKTIELTNLEIQFIFLLMWKLYNEQCKLKKTLKEKSIIEYLKSVKYIDRKVKTDVATALINIEYLNYFNPNDYKRELFDLAIKVE